MVKEMSAADECAKSGGTNAEALRLMGAGRSPSLLCPASPRNRLEPDLILIIDRQVFLARSTA
jgi:hypothetical protein